MCGGGGGSQLVNRQFDYFHVSGHLELFERLFLLVKINNFGGMG